MRPPITHLLWWVSANWRTLQNSTQCLMKLWTFRQPPEWSINCSFVDEWQCFWTIMLILRCKSWITFQYVRDEPNMPKTATVEPNCSIVVKKSHHSTVPRWIFLWLLSLLLLFYFLFFYYYLELVLCHRLLIIQATIISLKYLTKINSPILSVGSVVSYDLADRMLPHQDQLTWFLKSTLDLVCKKCVILKDF